MARTTVARILKDAGIAPAPERPTSWTTFLKAHAGVTAAADFLTVEVWAARGLVTHYVLFGIAIGSRAVEILGITTNPDSAFMAQVGRNLTDSADGFLRGMRFLVVDRDSKFDARFRQMLNAAGVHLLRTAVRAPNMNAFAERFVRTIKDECLSKLILFSERMLRRAIKEFVAHYHHERNHQALDNTLINPDKTRSPLGETVHRRERLGGLLSYYHRRRRAVWVLPAVGNGEHHWFARRLRGRSLYRPHPGRPNALPIAARKRAGTRRITVDEFSDSTAARISVLNRPALRPTRDSY